jgi:thymidylate kinase
MKVQISGTTRSGKSTVGQLFADFLRKEGFKVEVHDDSEMNGVSNLDKRLKSVLKRKEKVSIDFETVNMFGKSYVRRQPELTNQDI